MKKQGLILLAVLWIMGGMSLFAEQVTTVAVIDVSKVYDTFPNFSRGYESLNKLKEKYQKEIDTQVRKLDLLKEDKTQMLQDERYDKADELESRIVNMTRYIDALSQQRQDDLIRRSNQPVSKDFLERLQSAISYVSEEKGYTLVLRSSMEGIQWWAPIIDITDEVIARIRAE